MAKKHSGTPQSFSAKILELKLRLIEIVIFIVFVVELLRFLHHAVLAGGTAIF
jgi:hypothetical protein